MKWEICIFWLKLKVTQINYVSRNQLHNTSNGCQILNFGLSWLGKGTQYWCSISNAKHDQVFSVPCRIGTKIQTVLWRDFMKGNYGRFTFTCLHLFYLAILGLALKCFEQDHIEGKLSIKGCFLYSQVCFTKRIIGLLGDNEKSFRGCENLAQLGM